MPHLEFFRTIASVNGELPGHRWKLRPIPTKKRNLERSAISVRTMKIFENLE